MSSIRWFALLGGLFAGALAVSGVLYVRSQAADYDAHARVVEATGKVRHLDERLSEQVLAARFGLLNQYDPITGTEIELSSAGHTLGERIRTVVGSDAELTRAVGALEASIASQRGTVEHFKTENSVLKNSLRYLPTAANDADAASIQAQGVDAGASSLAVHRMVQAALVYDLIGDASTRDEHLKNLAALRDRAQTASGDLRADLELLMSHATVIGDRQPRVDGWVKQVLDNDTKERLGVVEALYHRRFGAAVATANGYRKILYAWSLLLLAAVGVAGVGLRRLYADLERRVAARTSELREALSALWGEMKLARKIQEALVPASPSGTNCEIAATMRPTTEVGGDYYDVVRMGEREWILIGDVSGHGVPAGLVMMMCHTAVRTVLKNDPDVMPDRLLAMVNSVLTENIRQLGEDKYMTITALRRDADGTVLFAGAHQDVYVYRAATDSVETQRTSGLWLGLRDQIGHTLSTKRLALSEGDLLLLYTDGITEARRDGKMFDTRGVRGVLGRARGKSAQQVLEEIFAELAGFEVADDATVVVLKQLGATSTHARRAPELTRASA